MAPRGLQRAGLAAALALLGALAPAPALAVDTMETWAPGAADVDFLLGADGLGGSPTAQVLFGDLQVGYGAAERLSVYLGTRLEADGRLGTGTPALRIGTFATVLDTERFDLDLVLELGAFGPGLGKVRVAPGAELNLDLPAPVGEWGLYLKAQVPIAAAADGVGFQVAVAPGAYWTVREGHEVLVEYRAAVLPPDAAEVWRWQTGSAALGYNVVVSSSLELIAELSAGPDERGGAHLGAMLGFVATIPGGPRR